MMTTLYHHDVRTTITIDEDVAARLRAFMRESGMGLKAALNATLRVGLEAHSVRSASKSYNAPTFDLGKANAGIDLDRIGEVVETLEGPTYQ